MKKFHAVLVLLLALASSGCYTIHTAAGPQRYIMPQVGVVVGVVNNCAPYILVERAGSTVVEHIPYGSSVTVPVASQPFSGTGRRIVLTVKGYTADRQYRGSVTREFYVNTHEGTREEVWEINYLNLPNGLGGCR